MARPRTKKKAAASPGLSSPAPVSPVDLAADASPDLAPIVGTNLRRLRKERSLSLEALSRASGVSRAMLGQIELGQSAPTINVLWKISRALGVPFSTLISTTSPNATAVMPVARARVLTSHDGAFRSRPLFPSGEPRNVEFYELKLAGRSVEEASAHPPGTLENLVVARGTIDSHGRRRRPSPRHRRRDPLRGRRAARVREPRRVGCGDVPGHDVHDARALIRRGTIRFGGHIVRHCLHFPCPARGVRAIVRFNG